MNRINGETQTAILYLIRDFHTRPPMFTVTRSRVPGGVRANERARIKRRKNWAQCVISDHCLPTFFILKKKTVYAHLVMPGLFRYTYPFFFCTCLTIIACSNVHGCGCTCKTRTRAIESVKIIAYRFLDFSHWYIYQLISTFIRKWHFFFLEI